MSGEAEGGMPQAHGGGFAGEQVLELSVVGSTELGASSALTIAHLEELVRTALEHGLPDDTVVIFERFHAEQGARRVRVTGAGVRVPVRESNLRRAEPATGGGVDPRTAAALSVGVSQADLMPDEEARRRFGELGGVIGSASLLRPRPVRDDPQA